jgi:hypothetical protein
MSRSAFVLRTRVGDGASLESRMLSGGLSDLYEGVSLESRMLTGGLRGLNPSR